MKKKLDRLGDIELTWVSADELWPRALLGREGVGSANQLVLGHLGVGLGELQPQGLGDFRIKPDPLGSNGKTHQRLCKAFQRAGKMKQLTLGRLFEKLKQRPKWYMLRYCTLP